MLTPDKTPYGITKSAEAPLIMTDKIEKFLWRENRFDQKLKDTFNTIVINDKLSKKLTDPERAAMGFVVTFVGSECDWEGAPEEDSVNLKCKALTSLGLGFQCSEKHSGFLKQWFRFDSKSLVELDNCATVPFTATSQNTFDFINLKTKDNLIAVEFGASGVNLRGLEDWTWTETVYFEIQDDHIKLIHRDRSEIIRET